MTLKLCIVKFPSAVAGTISLQPVTVGNAPVVIGRDEKCSLVLSDPKRFVSREHCRIVSEGGNLVLWVVSKTNGVQIDNRDVEPGEKHILSLGERIIIGEYELALEKEIDTESTQYIPVVPAPVGLLVPESHSSQKLSSDDPFGFNSPSDNFLLPNDSPSALGGVFAANTDFNSQQSKSSSHAFEPSNPFAELDEPFPDKNNNSNIQQPSSHVFVPSDPFAELDEPFTDKNDNSHTQASNRHTLVDDNPFAELGISGLPVSDPLERNDDPHGFNDSWINFKVKPVEIGASSINHVQPINEPFSPKAESEPIAKESKSISNNNEEAITKLLIDALGVDADRIVGVDDKELVQRVGLLLNKSVDLILTLLRLRAEVKDEMGDGRTGLSTDANNPLKISPNVVVALNFLLGKPVLGFMNYNKAINLASDDIIDHNRRLLTVPQYACQHVLQQLSPQKIEEEVEKIGGIGIKIQIQKDAKCWAQYKKTHTACHANLDQVIKKAFSV
ncbi:MAG: type VI secretion system-associated FHA domain protein TagH [Bacteroidetes bacterium]|nr:type VI secretion system-associated FHA domain protein TagH [Bacteroidota bacterium]